MLYAQQLSYSIGMEKCGLTVTSRNGREVNAALIGQTVFSTLFRYRKPQQSEKKLENVRSFRTTRALDIVFVNSFIVIRQGRHR